MRFAVAVSIVGCGSDAARESPPARRTGPQEPPAAPPPPVDRSLGAGYEMQRPVRDGGLTIVPILATGAVPDQRYLTLQDGMARGSVTVREQPGGGQIEALRVRNRSALPVLVLGGELVIDGHQDRVLAETAIIAAGKAADVRARCVESGRGEGGDRFRHGGALAELALRRAVASGDQMRVWVEVAAINERLGLAPPTGTYRHAAARQSEGATAARRDRIAAQLAADPGRARMVGLAVAIDGEVVAIDRFATPALFRQVEQALLASYAASDGPPRERARGLTPASVRALAERVEAVTTTAASFTALLPLDASDPRGLEPIADTITDPSCDATSLAQGTDDYGHGLYAKALIAFGEAFRCTRSPTAALRAFMAACRLQNVAMATYFYRAAPAEARAALSICVANGITEHDLRP